MDRKTASTYATVVDKPEEADFAIIRLSTPFEPRKGYVESLFHHGDLDFKGEQKKKILDLLDKVPTIVDIYMERPAVIPESQRRALALLPILAAAIRHCWMSFWSKQPEGKLPFETALQYGCGSQTKRRCTL